MLIHLDNMSLETSVEELAQSDFNALLNVLVLLIEADKNFESVNQDILFYLFKDPPEDFGYGPEDFGLGYEWFK